MVGGLKNAEVEPAIGREFRSNVASFGCISAIFCREADALYAIFV
jgi:hypothetical protein